MKAVLSLTAACIITEESSNMSVWSHNRKAKLRKPAPLGPRDDLTVRVAQRICQIVYSSCDCKQRGLNQVCDTMKSAAQHAMQEIIGQ